MERYFYEYIDVNKSYGHYEIYDGKVSHAYSILSTQDHAIAEKVVTALNRMEDTRVN